MFWKNPFLEKKWRSDELNVDKIYSALQLIDIIHFSHKPTYKDKSFLQENYLKKGLSISQVSKLTFSSKEAVRCGLRASGLKMRAKGNPNGHPAQPKYGQKLHNGHLVPHIAELRVVKAIHGMRSDGLSLRQICKYLDHIGVPTKCRGRKWHPQMVQRILSDRIPMAASSAIFAKIPKVDGY